MTKEKQEGKVYQNVTDSKTIELAQSLNLDRFSEKDEYPKSDHVRKLSPWIPKRDVDEAIADFPFKIYFDNQIGGENDYTFFSIKELAKNPEADPATEDEIRRGVAEWLEKWFYGVKPKDGLYLVTRESR